MDDFTQKLLNTKDQDVAVQAILRINQQFDFTGLAKEYDQLRSVGLYRDANRILLKIIGAMTKTIGKLEKQNALMEQDYKRLGRGRNNVK